MGSIGRSTAGEAKADPEISESADVRADAGDKSGSKVRIFGNIDTLFMENGTIIAGKVWTFA